MFSSRIFRTTDELDFIRGPQLAAYLRFEMLLWAAIALLSLLSLAGAVFLPAPAEPGAADARPALAVTALFSTGALVVFVAVWRFKKWGVLVLALWTAVLVMAAAAALVSPPQDWLFIVALVGFIVARVVVLIFEIRPRWPYFQSGLF